MNKISINAEQQLYVIDCGEGYSCFGFANARDHADQIEPSKTSMPRSQTL